MFAALLDHRYLIHEFVVRDIHNRYVGSMVGFFWSILNPLVQLTLYTVIFAGVLEQRFEENSSAGRFALYLFCALLPWMSIQEAVTRSSRTFIENSNLIKKIRFPLEVLPFGLVLSAFFHQCMGTLILLAVLLATGSLNLQLCSFLLLVFAVQMVMSYGLSLMVACLNVFFRDIAQILGVLFMIFFWVTPIVYPKARAPGTLRWLLELNPLTHMVEAYRYVLLGNPVPSVLGVAYWIVFSVALYYLGSLTLQRTRHELVDLI